MKKRYSIPTFSAALLVALSSSALAGDYYHSWGDLIADTNYSGGEDYGRRFYAKLGNDTIIHAIHGGEIERGTTELAEDIAGINTGTYDSNLYIFEDIVDDSTGGGDDRIFHISADEFDEQILLQETSPMSKVVSIHGAADTVAVVYIGGRNDYFRNIIKNHLDAAGFSTDMTPPDHLRGIHVLNTTNLGRTQEGVQLEITNGLRELLFDNLRDAHTRSTTKTDRYWDFVDAIRAAIDEADPHPEGQVGTFDLDVFESNSTMYLFYDGVDPYTKMVWLDGDEHFLFNQGSLLYYNFGTTSKVVLDDFQLKIQDAYTGEAYIYDVTFDPDRFDGTNFRKTSLEVADQNLPSSLYGIEIINLGNGDPHPTQNGQSWLYGELVHP